MNVCTCFRHFRAFLLGFMVRMTYVHFVTELGSRLVFVNILQFSTGISKKLLHITFINPSS